MLLAASASQGLAQIDDGLISYWPLDVVQGTKTPDLISFYDMELVNLTSDDLVDGKHGKAFSFSNERQTLLQRVHEPSDNLPANKHESYTLPMWVNVTGEGQNDLRIFSEGNTSNSNPLFSTWGLTTAVLTEVLTSICVKVAGTPLVMLTQSSSHLTGPGAISPLFKPTARVLSMSMVLLMHWRFQTSPKGTGW